MNADTAALLDWMRSRLGIVTMREVCSAGPRSTRRKANAEPALAELIAAGHIVEASSYPRTFRVVEPGAAPARSGSKLLDMLTKAADLDDVPAGLASYWAAVTVRDRLVASMRERNGLSPECECCTEAGHAIDRAVVEAFECEML